MASKSAEILSRFQESTVEKIWNALKTALDSEIQQFISIKFEMQLALDYIGNSSAHVQTLQTLPKTKIRIKQG